ncbi:MAG: M20 family metallopeptidase [Acidimicrobiia bacterium]|nr:M20 family metallopeptidase [Acidimicrobiia bacterium]NNF63591.1 M20 family metallopeptidase [Acidimicrobiia bacterium]
MDLKARAEAQFGEVEADLQAVSRWMYDNPELAYQEHASSAKLADFLAGHGFEVEHPAYGLDTAFVARAGTKGPEMIICAEYDALPEVGHACGHNIIATAALGAGVALAPLADELGCRVTVLGTPAEEHFGGKVDLIHAGAFSGAAASMMIHPAPNDVLDPGVLAVAHIDVEFFGKESHAAFAPQLGVNALDAAVQAYVNVSTLRQAIYPTDKLHGVITYGGGAPNVIPAHTSMSWYVRAATTERLEELRGRVEDCFAAAAKATGCTFKITETGHVYKDLVSNPLLADLYQSNSTELGRPLLRREDIPADAAGSTDMGNVSHVVPSLHPMLDIKSLPHVNHQKEFAAQTVTPDGERAIRDGALAMAWTTIDIATGNRWGEL